MDSQPSNKYSAKLFAAFQEDAAVHELAIEVLGVIMMGSPYSDTFKSFYNQFIDRTKPIKSWTDITPVILYLRHCSMHLCKQEGFDVEAVLSLAIEDSLQPFLDCLVPWIVSREGGWEDFLH